MSFDGLNILRRLRELDETVEIEAKAGTAAGEAAMKTVSAFSNEPGRGGGYLLFGVVKAQSDDDTVTYEVKGVADPDALASDFVTQCASMLNQPVRPDVENFTDPETGKVMVGAFIAEAADHQKPVYITKYGLPRGAFRRISGVDLHCTDDDLEVLFRRTGTATYDETIVRDATFEDLDPEAFDAYRKMRSDPEAPELALSNLDLARAVSAVKASGDTFTPTIAGLIVFGRRIALRRLFPLLRVEYIRVPSTVWAANAEGFDAVEVLDGLLLAVPRIYQNVLADIPRSFKFSSGNIERAEAPLIPARAIREAIVNAVMHRTYRTRQPIQIIRFTDRLEVRNPGVAPFPDDKLGEPGSVSRNEKIAAILHDTKLAENKGLGIPLMRSLVTNAGLLPPSFRSNRARDEFVATFGMQHFLDGEDLNWLTKFKRFSLDEDQVKALVFVRRNGSISNADYRGLNRVETLLASARLRELKQAGLLVPQGAGSGTTYRPGPAFQRPDVVVKSTAVRRPAASDREELLSGLPEDLRAAITALPKPTAGSELDDIVIKILSLKPLSGRKLGTILNRTPNAMARSLARLQSSGLVAPTQAEKWHPYQSYAVIVAPRDIDSAAEQGSLLDLLKSHDKEP